LIGRDFTVNAAAIDTRWSADYEVDQARRRYRLTEPANRLVMRQLEAEWEQALHAREQLREQHARVLAAAPRTLTAAQRDAIRALADDLPDLWHAPSTTVTDRKELLRLMIDKITVTVVDDTEQVDVDVTWAGGHGSANRIVRPVARLDQLSYYPALVARVPRPFRDRHRHEADRRADQRRSHLGRMSGMP
jgi:hypothetical protein